MGLLEALGVGAGDVVAAVGAGGKTTFVYRLAAEARASGLRVLVTTTTHMGTLPEEVTGPVLVESEGDLTPALRRALHASGRATLLGRRVRPDKLEGVSGARVDALRAEADLVVVEADGARSRSLKTPAPHEPVLPGSATLVVVLAGLDVLGQPLDEQRVHRLDRVLEATGRPAGSPVDEDVLVATLLEPRGYTACAPAGARLALFLNKAESEPALSAAERISARVVPPFALALAGSAREGVVRLRR